MFVSRHLTCAVAYADPPRDRQRYGLESILLPLRARASAWSTGRLIKGKTKHGDAATTTIDDVTTRFVIRALFAHSRNLTAWPAENLTAWPADMAMPIGDDNRLRSWKRTNAAEISIFLDLEKLTSRY